MSPFEIAYLVGFVLTFRPIYRLVAEYSPEKGYYCISDWEDVVMVSLAALMCTVIFPITLIVAGTLKARHILDTKLDNAPQLIARIIGGAPKKHLLERGTNE